MPNIASLPGEMMASIRNKRPPVRAAAKPRKTAAPHRKPAELDLRRKPMQARGQATFEAILDATATLLEQLGGERLTTNLIARAAAVNVATLYQYFPNKQTVLLELFRRHSQKRIEAIERQLSGLSATADWRRVIGNVIQEAANDWASTPGLAALRQMMRTSPDLLEHEQEYARHMAATLAEELRKAGLKRDQATLVARCTTEAITALLDGWLLQTERRDGRVVNEAKAMIVGYLAPHLGRNRK
jgi:AcrR family transcriptional regulator